MDEGGQAIDERDRYAEDRLGRGPREARRNLARGRPCDSRRESDREDEGRRQERGPREPGQGEEREQEDRDRLDREREAVAT
jgi:hypothetical protein